MRSRALQEKQDPEPRSLCASNDENVDPVGACVGLNGARVNAIVDELQRREDRHYQLE